MAIKYTNVAIEQQPFLNYPGGGPITQGALNQYGAPAFNDPGVEIGNVREVTAIYQFIGNENPNDVINIYLAQPGTMVTPTGTVTGNGVASALTLSVGDDDVSGVGAAASSTRYSSSIDVHANQQTASGSPVSFVGGDTLTAPYAIGPLAVEPVGGSTGAGIAGSWIQATLLTVATVSPGKVLVFRLKVVKP